MKNVLIISTSLRDGSNSEILAKECEKGALSSGHNVEFISLKGKEIKYCIGCLTCHKTGKCVLKDDINVIVEKIKNSDVVVFATPIYFYEMCGQMKVLLDRTNPLYTKEYKFREAYMIATAAEGEERVFKKAYNGLNGWTDCFEYAESKGLLIGGDMPNRGDAKNRTEVLSKAYKFGESL